MAIKQLSVFVENKKGSLHEITDTLAAAGVDLRSMCVADTANFGIVRIITDESDRAKELLDKAGHAANVREIWSRTTVQRAGSAHPNLFTYKTTSRVIHF